MVLSHDPWCSKALIAKAEALYNICDFEHRCFYSFLHFKIKLDLILSLMLFIRGRSVAPDSSVAANGVSKSTKTILNKISNPDIFFFMHSKTFFDFLRKDGSDAVNKFMKNEIKFKLKMMAALRSNANSKMEKKNEKGGEKEAR